MPFITIDPDHPIRSPWQIDCCRYDNMLHEVQQVNSCFLNRSKDIFSAIQLSRNFHAVMHARLLYKLKGSANFCVTFFDLQSLRTRVLYTRKLLEIIVQKIRLPVPYKSIDPKAFPLFPYFLEKRLTIPTSFFTY